MINLIRHIVWDTVGALLLAVLVFFWAEVYNHNASWDGVFNAAVKHTRKAFIDTGLYDQLIPQCATGTGQPERTRFKAGEGWQDLEN